MKPLSIRWKIALLSAALTAIALLVFAAGTLVNVYVEQIEGADYEIASEAQRLGDSLERGDLPVTPAARRQYAFDPWIASAVFDERGQYVPLSGDLPESLARSALPGGPARTLRSGAAAWRVAGFAPGGRRLVVAFNLEEVRDIVTDLLTAYALSLPLVAAIVGVGVWWLAGRILQPVRELTETARTITSQDLDRRVAVPPVDDEIGRLAAVFNDMLTRLERSFRQAGRFAADASHELLTPLTIIHAEIEQMLRRPVAAAELEARLVSLQDEIAGLERICEQLLLLARLDARPVNVRREPFAFGTLVAGTCEDAELLGLARGVQVEARIEPDLWVRGDPEHLRRVVLNLFDNATKFAGRGGHVRCTLRREGGQGVLLVANDGPAIPPADRDRIFERFVQVDPSRNGQGSGLGLSLSREIAVAHGGGVAVVDAEAGWTTFRFALPLAARGVVPAAPA